MDHRKSDVRTDNNHHANGKRRRARELVSCNSIVGSNLDPLRIKPCSSNLPASKSHVIEKMARALVIYAITTGVYFAINGIPMAFAQDDDSGFGLPFASEPLSSRPGAHLTFPTATFLVIATATVIHLTRNDPIHASGFSVFILYVALVIWDRIDIAALIIVGAVGLAPSLVVAYHQIQEYYRLRNSCDQIEEARDDLEGGHYDLEERQLDTPEDPNRTARWWKTPPSTVDYRELRQNVARSTSEVYRRRRQGSPDSWDGTEGFNRESGSDSDAQGPEYSERQLGS